MPPRVTTRSAGWPAGALRGGGTGGRAGRGGVVKFTSYYCSPSGRPRNVIENNDRRGCTYKEFLACSPKEYDGKGGVIVYTYLIEKMELVQDMSGMSWDNFKVFIRKEFCPSNEMQKLETKLWNYTMVGAGHAAYTDRMVAAMKPLTIQKVVKIAGILTDETRRNGSIKKYLEKRENRGEPGKDRNRRDDNKNTRTGNTFATTVNPVKREYTGYFAKDCRVVPKNVNPINVRNPTARACYVCGSTDHVKAARGRAFMLGSEEARQNPNIITGIEPNDLRLSYEIEIASGQLEEIDKVIKGCKLEIEGHVFDIKLIPFGSGSFNVIIGIDWLSNHRAEIIRVTTRVLRRVR
nr:hypothetical protein [Tanacetum cinerariifolium]